MNKKKFFKRTATLGLVLATGLFLVACGKDDVGGDTERDNSNKKNDYQLEDVEESTSLSFRDGTPISDVYSEPDDLKWANEMLNQKAPDFQASNLEGNTIALSAYKGSKVLLEIGTHSCPACISVYPVVKEFKDKYEGEIETLVVFPNDSSQEIKNFFMANDFEQDSGVYFGRSGNNMLREYKAPFYPSFIFIDEEGYIRSVATGTMTLSSLENFKELAFGNAINENTGSTSGLDMNNSTSSDMDTPPDWVFE